MQKHGSNGRGYHPERQITLAYHDETLPADGAKIAHLEYATRQAEAGKSAEFRERGGEVYVPVAGSAATAAAD